MRTESVHTALILGKGPAGLAARLPLAKAGHQPVITVDRDQESSGLMRSVHHGDFVVDISVQGIIQPAREGGTISGPA